MRRFGAGDIYLGQTIKGPPLEREDQALGRMYRDRQLSQDLELLAHARVNFARKKTKPPKAGGKRRRWKKDRAAIADLRRVFKRSIDELRHLTANALGFAEVPVRE